ncbi:MAG: addiction module protein [Verrucomicrobia subdivision 3 bacterium]|nr:addiction module protein [Limisphaerales bacterium]
MEAIWVDLRSRVENAAIPEVHRKLLDERRARVGSGETKLHEWGDVKLTIRGS